MTKTAGSCADLVEQARLSWNATAGLRREKKAADGIARIKNSPMHNELQPDSIRFTSDRIGFEGFRALVRDLPDEAEVGSGKRGWPCFQFGWQPVPGKRRVMLRFDKAGPALAMSRISAILPPDEPHVCRWQRAAGRTVSFEVHPRFFEETLRLAGSAAARFRVVPPPRFVINRRVGWLCQMLMEETEAGCPGGRAYFERVAAALLLAVGSPKATRGCPSRVTWERSCGAFSRRSQ